MSSNRTISPDTGFPDRMAGTRSRHPDAKVLSGPWEPEDPEVIFRRRLLSRSSTTNLLPPTTASSSFSRDTTPTSSTLTTPNRSPLLATGRPSTSSSAAFSPFHGATRSAPVPAYTEHSSSKERSGSFGSTSSAGTMMSSDSAMSSASKISASERSGWGAWAARIGEWNAKRKARRNASFRRLAD